MQVEKPFLSYTSGRSRKTFDTNFNYKVLELKKLIEYLNKCSSRERNNSLKRYSTLHFMYEPLSKGFRNVLTKNLYDNNYTVQEMYSKGNYMNLRILSDLFNIKIEFDEIL